MDFSEQYHVEGKAWDVHFKQSINDNNKYVYQGFGMMTSETSY